MIRLGILLVLAGSTSCSQNPTVSGEDVAKMSRDRTLELYDQDRDNVISPDEWEAARAGSEDPGEDFNGVDTDGDGAVSSEEILGYMKRRVSFGRLRGRAEVEGEEADRADYYHEPKYLKFRLFSVPLE